MSIDLNDIKYHSLSVIEKRIVKMLGLSLRGEGKLKVMVNNGKTA